MKGTVFHYAVVAPKAEHVDCFAQVQGIIAYHESIGYKQGGAYNGHFCVHGGRWISYLGPNQATGDTWANLNLHAWCYLATVDTPVTDPAAQAAYDLTLVEPTGRDEIHPHSDFYQTSCCGDPLRAWIAAGALPPSAPPPILEEFDDMRLYNDTQAGTWWFITSSGWSQITPDEAFAFAAAGIPQGKGNNQTLQQITGHIGNQLANFAARIPSGGTGACRFEPAPTRFQAV